MVKKARHDREIEFVLVVLEGNKEGRKDTWLDGRQAVRQLLAWLI